MYKFNVINWDFNRKQVEYYNIMPYLLDRYKEVEDKPSTFQEFREFVKRWGKYQWWARCEYEVIISQWPPERQNPHEEKIDVWDQVEQNLDVVSLLLMHNVHEI